MSRVNRQLGVNSAIILNYGETNQGTIKGLNSLTLPALTRSKIKSEEFGVDFAVNDVGGGEHGDISYSGNMITGDTNGQTQLKTYIKNNTKFKNARIYIDTETSDFLGVDATANDPETGFQVIDHTPGAANKNGTYPFSGKWAVNGLYCIYDIHMTASAGATIAVNGSQATVTIVDPGSNFIDNGITSAHTIILDNGTTLFGPWKLACVASGTLYLAAGQTVASGAGITTARKLHAGLL